MESVSSNSSETPSMEECLALIERVASSSHFSKSARLRDFLRYVGKESLKPGAAEIHEQEIGVKVFGRSETYDRSQDNIVRVNATELRKRIEAYFSLEGADEPLIFSIPRGSYSPLFQRRQKVGAAAVEPLPPQQTTLPAVQEISFVAPVQQKSWHSIFFFGVTAVSGVLLITCLLLLLQNSRLRKANNLWENRPTVTAFWTGVGGYSREIDVVLPDASVSLAEEMTGKRISLSQYLDRNFISPFGGATMTPEQSQALHTVFNHNLVTLGDFHAAQQILSLTPISPSIRLILARFFEAEAMKRNNIVLLGGRKANPWVGLFDEQMNFVLDYDGQHNQVYVANRHPVNGEESVYKAVMDKNALVGYSVVAYLPNPSKTGHVIILAGTDSDATGAAAEFLTSEENLQALQRKFQSKQLPHFEVLLKTSRLNGTSFSAEVVTYRIVP